MERQIFANAKTVRGTGTLKGVRGVETMCLTLTLKARYNLANGIDKY
jgi:hypothetical protein